MTTALNSSISSIASPASSPENTGIISTGPITIDDVRLALGGHDPMGTNAGALRNIIGRGSMQTIQKHLGTLRAELAPAAAVEPGSVPPAPADVVQQLWAAAFNVVQSKTLHRIDALVGQRDTALAVVQTQSQDLTAFAANIDALTDELSKANSGELAHQVEIEKVREVELKNTSAALLKLDALQKEHDQQMHQVQLDMRDRLTEHDQLKHQVQLNERDRLTERLSMESIIDRLLNQVSEYKSLLHARNAQAPVSVLEQMMPPNSDSVINLAS
jgi:hypothetical protein